MKSWRLTSISTLLFICARLLSFGQTFSSSNLPIIIINTNGQIIPDEPKITADMGIIYNGPAVRNSVTDPFNNYNGKIGIELRGTTSQEMFPKKQYGIELRDGAGASIDASLLGLPKKDDWVLFAPYDDKSLMRDVLAYKLGRDLGRYASRSKYCEVILNGQYQGVYVLLEKIKRDKSRVNIDKLDPVETAGDILTGGYIIKIDKTTGSTSGGWTSSFVPPNRSGSQTIYFQYDYPKPEDIIAEQKQYIKDYFAAFETALAGSAFKDPAVGYQKYIDVGSFVDYFIANELSRNPDAYRLSTFMYKRKDSDGGKLFMGPIWDFNLGFGNVNFCAKEKPEGFIINYNSMCRDDYWLIPFWWSRLFEDPAFKQQVVARWTSLRSDRYQTSRIMGYIDSVTTVLNVEAQQRNFQRWPVLGQYVWPNAFVGKTFQQEVDWLKDWTAKRLLWLDANLPDIVTATEERPAVDELHFAAYPNPCTDRIQLDYELAAPNIVSISLMDITGTVTMQIENRYEEIGKHQVFLSFSSLPSGMFLVRLTYGHTTSFLKIMKR